jgi:hypothetical protein
MSVAGDFLLWAGALAGTLDFFVAAHFYWNSKPERHQPFRIVHRSLPNCLD